MKSRLAIFIIASGWLFFIIYIIIEFIYPVKHLLIPQEVPNLIEYILVAIIPVVFTALGYLVNKKKRLLRAYKETEKKYRDLYQNTLDGYYYTGTDGAILEVNDRFLEMLGYQREDVVGKKRLKDIFSSPGETLQEFGQKYPRKNFECELLRKDGTRLPVVINTTAFYDEKGNYLKSMGIVRDISDVRKIKEKLNMSQTAFLNMLKDLDLSYKELKKLHDEVISSFISAIDAKSTWTKGHSERVTNYAVAIAKEMGLSEKEIETLRTAAILHDIGKLGTYDVILDKNDDLTDQEIELIKMHTIKGEEILRPISQLKDILPVIRSHHERIDGTGYPDGLKDTEIPFLSRIIAVADTFDSMTSDRPYRPRVSKEDAIRELKKFSGTQFDFEVVEAFSNMILKDEM
ncbi:MAG: HD domain-containing phosphohydrolase [Thermodesulfovibrionales bacterium]